MFFHSLIAKEYAFTLFFLLLIARLMWLDHRAGGSFLEKGLN